MKSTNSLELRRRRESENRPMVNAWKARWRVRHGEVAASHQRKWRAKNRVKVKAQLLLKTELRAGRVVRPEYCEECFGVSKPHGHHSDYSKPLEVRWLCAKCHKKAHLALIGTENK